MTTARCTLEGAELDAAVAKIRMVETVIHFGVCYFRLGGRYSPSSDWHQGGPILEESPWLLPRPSQGYVRHMGAFTSWTPAGFEVFGPTPLVAAMRAFVASFGDTP